MQDGQRAGPSPHDSLFVAPQPNLHGSPSPQGLDVASLTHEQLLGNSLYLSLVTEQAVNRGKLEALSAALANRLHDLIPAAHTPTHPQQVTMASVFPAPLPSVLRPNMHSTDYNIYPLPSPGGSQRDASNTPPPFRPGQMAPKFPYPPYDRIQREQKDYPGIKFWTKEDAMKDPVAHPNKNVRHPIMKKIVEDREGALVDEARFGEIQGHVRTAASKTLDLKSSWTKQSQARQQEFIAMVEQLAPELSYCEPEGWKAVAMARTYLDGKTRRGREMTDGTGKKGKKRMASEALAAGEELDDASQSQMQEDDLTDQPAKRLRSADINICPTLQDPTLHGSDAVASTSNA